MFAERNDPKLSAPALPRQIGLESTNKMGRLVEATQPSDPTEVISNVHARITPL